MRFKVETSGYFYSDKDKKKLEKLGFKFEPADPFFASRGLPWRKTWEGEAFVEINSLGDLIRFQGEWGDIIIRDDFTEEGVKVIEIYDDYRE